MAENAVMATDPNSVAMCEGREVDTQRTLWS